MNKIRVVLNLLKDEKAIRELRGSRFLLLKADLRGEEIERFSLAYKERGETDREKLERLMLYAQSALCRWRILREYFEDEPEERCDNCDNCINPIEERLKVEIEKPAIDEQKMLEELRDENEVNQVEIGDPVVLPQHDKGQVKTIVDDKLEVVFPNGATKTFKKEFVKEILRKTSARQ